MSASKAACPTIALTTVGLVTQLVVHSLLQERDFVTQLLKIVFPCAKISSMRCTVSHR